MALASLFLHEAYHHKTEALAVRLHVVERVPCYRSYSSSVYEPCTKSQTKGPLEEALANAESFVRLVEPAYGRFVSPEVLEATREYLRWRFPLDPPGYSDAVKYLDRMARDNAQNELRSQVQEGKILPFRPSSQWRLAPNLNESLFGLTSDIWLVVPAGHRPRLPTFPLYRPVPASSVQARLLSKRGYSRVKGGKGSHVKLKAPGQPTITLPGGGKRDLAPHELRNVARALGFSDSGDLLDYLGL
jgi:predicted RNA binding protein YcfA (HicA-like mRNA interferase family)